MIPMPLDQISWNDLEALRGSGREESDTIEFKASFSGGSDFCAFTDAQRERAVKAVAKEAIAFMNARGGDIIIGAAEESGERPQIANFNPLPNVSQAAERLAQSLQALIEPYQTVLGVRAIRNGEADEGVIVVRAPESLRAPHRFIRDKECYVRRGRESVAMPMDEIQDLALRRFSSRSERFATLDEMFSGLAGPMIGRRELSAHRVHFRCCYVPLVRAQVKLEENMLLAFNGRDPNLSIGCKIERNDVAFRGLRGSQYSSILRGKIKESYQEGAWRENDFIFSAKTIREDGILVTDFSCRCVLSESKDATPGFHSAWVAGYFANTLVSIAQVLRLEPTLSQGFLRVVTHAAGQLVVGNGDGMWAEHVSWPTGTVPIPDFEINHPDDVLGAFQQLQVDVASIAGLRHPQIYEFAEPQ